MKPGKQDGGAVDGFQATGTRVGEALGKPRLLGNNFFDWRKAKQERDKKVAVTSVLGDAL